MKKEEQGASPIQKDKILSLSVAAGTTFISLIPTAYAALVSNSVTLLADLLRCVVEFGAIFLSLIVVWRVSRGDRSQFNYGFGKLEEIAGLGVAMAMLGTFLVLALTSVLRFVEPLRVENAGFGFVFGVLSVSGNVALWVHNLRLARRDSSPILEAQWRLFRNKTFASLVVALSVGLSWLLPSSPFTLYVDPLGSLLLSGFILFSAYGLLSSSMRDLLDCSIDEAAQLAIIKVLVQHEQKFVGLSEIRTRRSGGRINVEIFLHFDGSRSLKEVQGMTDDLRVDINRELPGASIVIVPQAAEVG